MLGPLCGMLMVSCSLSLENSSLLFPRIIWTYHSGEMHSKVKMMLHETKTTLSETWSFIVLSDANLSLFLNISSFPPNLLQYPPTTKSDYIRLRLLSQYGGWWLDTAIQVSSKSLFDNWMDEIVQKQAQMFGICFTCPRGIIENGLLFAPRGSIVIRTWLEQVETMYRAGISNYIYTVYRNGISFHPLVLRDYPYIWKYMVVYAAQKVAIDRVIPRRTTIVIKDTKKTLFEWLQKCNTIECRQHRANAELERPQYAITKIGGSVRKKIWGTNEPEFIDIPDAIPLALGISIDYVARLSSLLWILESLCICAVLCSLLCNTHLMHLTILHQKEHEE